MREFLFKTRIQNDENLARLSSREGGKDCSRYSGTVILSFSSLWNLFISVFTAYQHPGCSALSTRWSQCAYNLRGGMVEERVLALVLGQVALNPSVVNFSASIFSSIKWIRSYISGMAGFLRDRLLY